MAFWRRLALPLPKNLAGQFTFLLETNPGPGLGLLVAYYVAGKGLLKESAPGCHDYSFLGWHS